MNENKILFYETHVLASSRSQSKDKDQQDFPLPNNDTAANSYRTLSYNNMWAKVSLLSLPLPSTRYDNMLISLILSFTFSVSHFLSY